jgi:hypothetical protein
MVAAAVETPNTHVALPLVHAKSIGMRPCLSDGAARSRWCPPPRGPDRHPGQWGAASNCFRESRLSQIVDFPNRLFQTHFKLWRRNETAAGSDDPAASPAHD